MTDEAEPPKINWRIHKKFRRYDVWFTETCATAEEARDRHLEKARYIGRENIPIASIVDGDKVSIVEQAKQDEDKPDGYFDVLCAKTPEELKRIYDRWDAESKEAANRLMKNADPMKERVERILAGRRKRRAQVADDPGNLKDTGDFYWNWDGMIPEELPPEKQEEVKQYRAGHVKGSDI